MISIERCKKYLEEYGLTDAEVEEFRNSAYVIINEIIDQQIGRQNETTKTDNRI